uniref:BTB domain-containing protein n=1 Tax=Graphocephala atropunctata TaxID=36148 RepID=A0A1B6MNW1_9HEMI
MASPRKEGTRKNSEHKKLLEGLFAQKNTGTLCDVQLQIQGSNIWGHACVLATCSSYFSQCFQFNVGKELTWENHWCHQKPLVIDLGTILNKTEILCSICVCKIIDFMYLRELVVMQGHFQHFCEIVRILNIFDLLPLCEQYIDKKFKSKTKLFLSDTRKDSENLTPNQDDNDIRNHDPTLLSLINQRVNTSKINQNVQQQNASENIVSLISIQSDKNHKQGILGTKTTVEVTEGIVDLKNDELTCSRELISLKREKDGENGIISMEHNYTNQIEDISKEPNNSGCDCDCCFDNKVSQSSNGVKHSKKRKMSCEICTSKSTSVKLMLKHIEDKNHYGTVCPICNMQTQNVNNFKQHVNDHANSKPYFCHICKKRNRHWENHKMHLRTHCKNKQFICEVCYKSFSRSNNLMVHLKTHSKTYLCKECHYLTIDIKIFKTHMLQHSDKNVSDETAHALPSDCSDQPILNTDLKQYEIEKKFHCKVCGKSFTKKKNLLRHIELKHTSVPDYNCSFCNYLTKRTDLLRKHLKKHHNFTPSEEEERRWKGQKKESKKHQTLKEIVDESKNVMGVLIPVQLVSTSETFLNSFSIKNGNLENVKIHKENYVMNQIEGGIASNNFTSNQSQSNGPQPEPISDLPTVTQKFNTSSHVHKNMSGVLQTSNINENKVQIDGLSSMPSDNDACSMIFPEVTSFQSVQVDLPKQYSNSDKLSKSLKRIYPDPEVVQNLHIVVDNKASQSVDNLENGSDFIDSNEDIWLNEATGELLTGNNFMKIRLLENDCVNNGNSANTPITPSFDFNDPFQTLILNEATNGLPVFDFVDDTDDLKSNPQTPQTNLVEFDDSDSYFSWNCLDSGFCSLWVLNEATGELNMVSFGMQPLKNSDDLELDENTGTLTSKDDDETALFLNEGTGDLSVIYFNPNKRECDSPLHLFSEKLNQDALETRSEHSDDGSEFLNEEFLRASASFMADSGNETFLNELTGEFDTANLSNYQQESKATGNQHVYLNEETGEISSNIFNNDLNSGLLPNAEMLPYDYDDSIHCEDFEPFSTEMDDFSSQLCLESHSENDWQPIDENCDTLLNECTGEFVKK